MGGGRGPHRVQIREPAVGGLHGGEGDERGLGTHRVGQLRQRDVAHPQVAAHRERGDDRTELPLGSQHFGTGRQRAGDQTYMDGDRAADGDPAGVDTGETRETAPGPVHRLEIARTVSAARGVPLGEGSHRVDGAAGQQSAGGRVEVGGFRRELGGHRTAERRDHHGPSLNPP